MRQAFYFVMPFRFSPHSFLLELRNISEQKRGHKVNLFVFLISQMSIEILIL